MKNRIDYWEDLGYLRCIKQEDKLMLSNLYDAGEEIKTKKDWDEVYIHVVIRMLFSAFKEQDGVFYEKYTVAQKKVQKDKNARDLALTLIEKNIELFGDKLFKMQDSINELKTYFKDVDIEATIYSEFSDEQAIDIYNKAKSLLNN